MSDLQTIYYLEGSRKKDLLVTFKIFDSSASEKTDGYTVIDNDDKYIYSYKIAEGELKSVKITEKNISDLTGYSKRRCGISMLIIYHF